MIRFHQMDWWERRERIGWYLRIPFVFAFRTILIGLYLPFALILVVFGVRFLTSRVTGKNFGGLALDPAKYIICSRFGPQLDRRPILVIPPWRLANRALLRYWGSHIAVVDNPLLAVLLNPFNWGSVATREIYPGVLSIDGPTVEYPGSGPANDGIIGAYEERYPDTPLLEISPEHEEGGRRELARLGVPENAWWVTLHVRSAGYYGETRWRQWPDGSPRDVGMESFFDAIDAIVERGGWVIRIGDPTMPHFPAMKHVIDYVHSDARSDWMDIFLLGRCRFMLGTDSGAIVIPWLFFRPVVKTNTAPMGHGGLSERDLFIPKVYRHDQEERNLSFHEVFSTGLRDLDPRLLASVGITAVDNTPQEIRDLTVEMLDRLDSLATYTAEDELARVEFGHLLTGNTTPDTVGTRGRIGREFLRTYSSLLWESKRAGHVDVGTDPKASVSEEPLRHH